MTDVFGHLPSFIRSVLGRLEISVSHIVPTKYKQISSVVELSSGNVYVLLWMHVYIATGSRLCGFIFLELFSSLAHAVVL